VAEDIRHVTPESGDSPSGHAAGAAAPLDVLLIADEPWNSIHGRAAGANRRGRGTNRSGQPQPLDMESVVQRLIALLSEESQP